MSDQGNLPGQSPEQLRLFVVKARLVALARELAALDVDLLARGSGAETWEERLATAFMQCKRRLRETGVTAQLAHAAFLEGQKERDA